MNDFIEVVSVSGAVLIISLIFGFFVVGLIFAIPVIVVAVIGMIAYSYYSPNSAHNQKRAEQQQTYELYEKAKKLEPLSAEEFENFVIENFVTERVRETALELFHLENFQPPMAPPPILDGIEGGKYRDDLLEYINTAYDTRNAGAFKSDIREILVQYDRTLSDGHFFYAMKSLNADQIESLICRFYDGQNHFEKLRATLNNNLDDQRGVLPSQYNGRNCAWDYLKHTPLLNLERKVTAEEWNNRAAHTLVLGGSGSGKTTLFKFMIRQLLKEDCCIVLMDSQSQVIEELAHLKLNDEDVTWLSPENALALNPFDIDPEDQRDETVINNKISLLEFVVENLIEAPMTPRQKNLFYFCTQLVLAIPGGNVKTFKEILKDPFIYSDTIETLDETARDFFFKELKEQTGNRKGNSYDSTRQALAYRLDGLTKQPTFRRIFQTKESTFDFYNEMQQRKLILLDTSQSLLADDSATFGRFLIANALQACFQRVRNKQTKRPVYFFVDEAHEYFDEKLERMLLQARKANVGMVLATQDFSRATKAGIADTLVGSTSTKIVSKVIAGDAKRLAPAMKTSADLLTDLSDHTFGYFSGQETTKISTSRDPLSQNEKRGDLALLKTNMEGRYGPQLDLPEPDPEPDAKVEAIDEEAGAERSAALSSRNVQAETKPVVPNEKQDGSDNAKGPKSSQKSKTAKRPKKKPPMSQSWAQDIEPGDQL